MFALQVLYYRSLIGARLLSRRHCADRAFELQRQLREGEILLGHRCWEALGEEPGFESPYWNLRETRTKLDRTLEALAEAEQTLAELDESIQRNQRHQVEVDKSAQGLLPPQRSGFGAGRSETARERRPTRPEPGRKGPLGPLGNGNYRELNEIRAEARELQRRFKTIQTKLRVRREEQAGEEEIARLRGDLASIRSQFDQCRRRLARLSRQLPDAAAAKPAAAEGPESAPSEGADNDGTAAPAAARAATERSEPSPAAPEHRPDAPPGADERENAIANQETALLEQLRQSRRQSRTECDRLRSEQNRLLRLRDEALREIGGRLRRSESKTPLLQQQRRRQRELIRRLDALATEATLFTRLQGRLH